MYHTEFFFLEMNGKRDRKTVERLSFEKETKEKAVEKGSGVKLEDIPYVLHMINTVNNAIII